MSIFDSRDKPLVEGVRIVPDYPLLTQLVGLGLPPGRLMVLDMEGDSADLPRDAWEERYRLVYITAGELGQASTQQGATVVIL